MLVATGMHYYFVVVETISRYKAQSEEQPLLLTRESQTVAAAVELGLSSLNWCPAAPLRAHIGAHDMASRRMATTTGPPSSLPSSISPTGSELELYSFDQLEAVDFKVLQQRALDLKACLAKCDWVAPATAETFRNSLRKTDLAN